MSNIVRGKLEAYFSTLNSTSNRMMEDIITSRKPYSDKWDNMQPHEQSDILWKSIVKPEILTKYNDAPTNHVEVDYFPVLSTRPGAKIICDEDTASAKSFVSGSTWHDEHSAPFRWETQSQIDFRLNDDSEKEGTLNRTDSHKVKSLPRDMPKPESDVVIMINPAKPESHYAELINSPKPERRDTRMPTSPKPERNMIMPKSPKPEKRDVKIPMSPKPERHDLKIPASPKPERHDMVMPKSPKPDRHDLKIPRSPKKEDDIKRHTIKRPEVPPPPVPPHSPPPPVPPHIDNPPVPPHTTTKKEKGETPIYAKVVKRKSANAKTLVISELKAHRKAKEEMKPAVPPRMSLELKGSMDLTKYSVHSIDIDGIPKTGFDFLDNW